MAQSILIVQGHPDPQPGRFCQAIAEAYEAGAAGAGHAVHLVRVAALDFPLLRRHADFYGEDAAAPAALLPTIEALKSADHIVIIYPLWLGGMPAYTRGFFEQVARPGVALEAVEKGFPKALLKGKSARLIVTMGMPAFAFRWLFGALSVRGFIRSVLNFAGISPVRTT